MRIGIGEFFIEFGVTDLLLLAKNCGRGVQSLTVPKNDKGQIGIVVAISTESDAEEKRLSNDLIAQLHQCFRTSQIAEKFKVLQFPQRLARTVVDGDTAALFLDRSRSHFIVYGKISRRKIKGEDSYVFRLHGGVRHRPVTESVRQKVASEFKSVLPELLAFPESDELLGFEITEVWLEFVAKYIIGIAAHISRDFYLSRELFLAVQDGLSRSPHYKSLPFMVEMHKRLPMVLKEALYGLMWIGYDGFARERSRCVILNFEQYADEALSIDPEFYNAILYKAVCLYFRGDAEQAIVMLESVRCQTDNTWRYSLGFLYAFVGRTGDALECYKRAFRSQSSDNVCNDTEIFVGEAIECYPDRIELIFFRGLINLKARCDLRLALVDFERFLAKPNVSDHPVTEKLAKNYCVEIRREMNKHPQ